MTLLERENYQISFICEVNNMEQRNLSQKQTHGHREQTVFAEREGVVEGWSGNLGLAVANYYT